MKRTLISLAMVAVFGAASAASAATVTLASATGSTISPGESIVLTVTTTANSGETDNTIFGAITYSDALLNPVAPASVMNTPIGFLPGAITCTTVRCVAFSAVTGGAAIALDPSQNTNFLLATVTFPVDAAAPIGSVINLAWQTNPSTQRLDFFGVTGGPGVSITVVPVPEPTTAALLGLGLFGLAVAGRRRA